MGKKAFIDVVMGGVGTFGGPFGFVISSVYFLIDPLDPNKKNSETHSEEITPIDNAQVKRPILKDILKPKKTILNSKEQPVIKSKPLF